MRSGERRQLRGRAGKEPRWFFTCSPDKPCRGFRVKNTPGQGEAAASCPGQDTGPEHRSPPCPQVGNDPNVLISQCSHIPNSNILIDQKSPYPNMPAFQYLDILISQHPNSLIPKFPISLYPTTSISQIPKVPISQYPEIQKPQYPDIPKSL